MEKPKTICHVAWARWNDAVARQLGDEAELELTPYEVRVYELPPTVHALTIAVGRAASELEGTSDKGDRIACQLLEALAVFARDSGT